MLPYIRPLLNVCGGKMKGGLFNPRGNRAGLRVGETKVALARVLSSNETH
jgi:hypothetical protein